MVTDIVVSASLATVIKGDGFPQTSVFAYVPVLGVSQLVGPTQNILGVFTLASSLTGAISAPTVSELMLVQDFSGYNLLKSGSTYMFQTILGNGTLHDVYDAGNGLISGPNPQDAYADLYHNIVNNSVRNY